ncbi:hypothetical protein MTsPCn5_14380 [Croceitalea sp. MTPC5]|nr:hypothetical protein MTsPCn5_14380 [Croceitalea sp. MTPC5]
MAWTFNEHLPTIPSVVMDKCENRSYVLTFRELEFLTGFLLTEFFTFNHSRVSSK